MLLDLWPALVPTAEPPAPGTSLRVRISGREPVTLVAGPAQPEGAVMPHPVLQIGPYVVGEIPAPLEYQFLDADGTPINLTGYTAKFQWGRASRTEMFVDGVTVAATVTDAVAGKVTRTWDGTEFLIQGDYAGMFFVGNGTNRFASLLLEWSTCLAIGPVPNI